MLMQDRRPSAARIPTLLLAVLCFPLLADAQLLDSPFSDRPTDLVTAARTLAGPTDSGVVVLLNDVQIAFDTAGRAVETEHLVYRIGSAPAKEWSIVGAAWQPWRQQRPAIRARVVTADAREVQLDERALAETPIPTPAPDIFPDGRILRGPLPATSAGAIVEVQITIRDTQPLSDRGLVRYLHFGRLVPTLRSIVTVEVPSTVPLRHVVHLLPNAVASKTTSGKTTTLKVENGRLEALDPDEIVSTFSEKPNRPFVAFSTGASWNDLARGYGSIVDSSIATSNTSGLLKEIVGEVTDRKQVIDRILQRVQRRVRYAAVELSAGSIIPRSPEETLNVEYGDCKDQAALLISLLRAAGIEAHMALLRAGTGPDVDPELPGFGAFDHAIVYIPGADSIWIDSTTRFSRAGQLPVADQGRLALIVKPDTTALIRTPEQSSRSIESHEVFLAESGLGRIIATREFFGTSELVSRVVQNQLTPEQTQKLFAALYSAKSISNLERTDVADFSSPYRMRFEAVDSQLAQTSGGEAVFFLPANPLKDSELSALTDLHNKVTAAGLDLGEVSVQEWRYRITPPPGYRRVSLPENSKLTLGPATLTRTFSEGTDGTISGIVRLDSGKRRYSGEDLAALKEAAKKLDSDNRTRISFEQTAQALLDEGKIREALKEFRELIQLHPQESVHHRQFAKALLSAGLGEMARAEAKRAVELEPKSADAHATLGWVLEHDGIGRRWKTGFDFDGAKAAFEKALEIAPDDTFIRSNFAILLEFDRNGERYAAGLDLGPAIDQYRKIQDKLDAKSPFRRNLPLALFWMKRYAELKTASTPSDIRLAAIAASDGISAAVREAGRLDPVDRVSSLENAAFLLIQTRLYEQAAALSRAGATGANAQVMLSRADQWERMHRYEEFVTDKKDPATIARQFFVRALLGGRGEDFSPLLTKAGQLEVRANSTLKPDIALRPIAPLSGIGGLSASLTADSAVSSLALHTDGDDKTGYRINLGTPLAGANPNRASHFLYVVLEDGDYRVLTADRSDFALAQGVLRFLEKGDLTAARKWLDWLEKQADLGELGTESLNTEAFFKVWFNSPVKDRTRMRLAAATLLSASPTAASTVLPILLEGRNTTPTGLVRDGLSLAYGTALLTLGRTEESLAVGQQLLRVAPNSRAIFLVAECMLRLGQLDALNTLLQQTLPKAGDVREVTLLLASVELKQGKVTSAEARLKSLASSGRNRGDDRRVEAWFSLYKDQITTANLTEAQQSASSRDSGWMRVLAALYAETGKTAQAFITLSQSMDAGARREPDPDDWYVLGRIYEQVGEAGAAESAYRKAIARKESSPRLDSASLLAQRHLDALKTSK